ncbi:MAG: metallophosphoesterase [Acidimicrobiia bacterium]|nr:metallophosphoesterase [Acidimicrobiia bacterium]
MRHLTCLVLVLLLAAVAPAGQEPLRFAVVGDAGTGGRPQFEIAQQMAAARAASPFDFVLLLGDNMYGRQEPQDFVDKFERPYAALLGGGVRFFAALGNHDKPDNRLYAGFNMKGERYYTFARGPVRFVILDTNQLDPKQLGWADDTLARATERWKVVSFHHPLYSNGGRHGSNVELRVVLEPLLVRHGVNVVFSGHEHIYERLVPQKGITYFVAGSGGQLRKGDLRRSATTAAGFDEDRSFLLVEIAGDEMSFRAIARTGRTVDAGVIGRRPST